MGLQVSVEERAPRRHCINRRERHAASATNSHVVAVWASALPPSATTAELCNADRVQAMPSPAGSPARLYGKRRDPATALASPKQLTKADTFWQFKVLPRERTESLGHPPGGEGGTHTHLTSIVSSS